MNAARGSVETIAIQPTKPSSTEAAEVGHGVQIHCAERYWLFGDRSNSNRLAGCNTDSLQGTSLRGPLGSTYWRGRSDPCCDRMAFLFGGRSGARQIIVSSVIGPFV